MASSARIGGLAPLPVFFSEAQLEFEPGYEWAAGEKIIHPEHASRAESILGTVGRDPAFEVRPPAPLPSGLLRRQHASALITLFETAAEMPEGETLYPSVFPRDPRNGDPTNLHHAGAFCFDAGTPLSARTLDAVTWSAASAHAAARAVLKGTPAAYALSRPPGHHATRDLFGGYCYVNNCGLAARALRRRGRVVVLDIDFHHGNGTQALFYRDPRVFTVSLHGDPRSFFPYHAGYAVERGAGLGLGYNLNIPLDTGCDGQAWLHALDTVALPAVRAYDPASLVIAAGFDTYVKDPLGEFTLQTADYEVIGERIGRLGLPTVMVQEGGYHVSHLGRNVGAFLRGVRSGQSTLARSLPKAGPPT